MTYRERREARAARLRGWAETRQERASATLAANDALPYAHDIAFLTQPGRIVARERMNASEDRAYASLAKAASMSARADSIERAADHAIYSDDPDAKERLIERIAEREAKRDAMKAKNAEHRKAHRAELATQSAYQRDQAMPHQGWEVSNLTADIGRLRQRLASLDRLRMVYARRGGSCAICALPFAAGEVIAEGSPAAWSHRTCAEVARSEGVDR